MIPLEPDDRADSPPAGVEPPSPWPVITEQEWQRLYREVLVPGASPGGSRPAGEGVRPPDGAVAAREPAAEGDAAPTPPPAPAGRRERGAAVPPALTEQEWGDRFFQRGQLTGLAEGDDLLILTAPDVAGGVTSLRLRGDALTAVAAAALRQHPAGLDLQDYEDLVLLRTVLDWCVGGVPLESRPSAEQVAVSAMAQRYPGLIARVAALLPPR